MKKWLAIALMSVVLSSCAGRAIDTYCLTAKPVYPTKQEITGMTDETVQRLLEHNEYGRKTCGWTERTK